MPKNSKINLKKIKRRIIKIKKNKIKLSSPILLSNQKSMNLASFISKKKIKFYVDNKTYYDNNIVVIRLKSNDKIPPFEPAQYVSLEFNINQTYTTRPYSITSSLKHIFEDEQYIEITVRKMNDGFISKYLYHTIKVGDEIYGRMPYGSTYHVPIRDSKNVVMIASGRGITPILPVLRSINDGYLDLNLTIVYTAKTFNDYIAYDELKKANTHFLLTDTPHDDIPLGIITKEFLKEISLPDSTYYIFGSNELNKVVENELLKLNVPKRRIRPSIDVYRDYTVSKIERYFIKVILPNRIIEITAKNSETILTALENNNIHITSICRRGKCGACLFKLVEGHVECKKLDYRRQAEIEFDYFHACTTYPISNLTIRLLNYKED